MRISDQTRHTANLRHLETASQRMDTIQNQLSSGRRIQRASDDPAGVSISLGYRASINFETQMRRNMDSAVGLLNVTDVALDSATSAVQRIRELAVQASTGTLGPDERTAIASEVDQLMAQLVQVGNTNYGGQYIFAGFQSRTPAYAVTGQPATAVAYQGDAGVRETQVSTTSKVLVNIPGSTVFGTMFDDVIAFRQALETNAPIGTVQQGISAMDTALDRILSSRSEVGARVNRLEQAAIQSEDTDTTLQQLRADVEDVDIAETILNMNANQNALDATLGAIGRVATRSLLDFLR